MRPDEERERLRQTFDQAAGIYDRVRPDYPEALFGDLIALTGLVPGDRLLEVGCATGQAICPLARRGFPVTCIELAAGSPPSPAGTWRALRPGGHLAFWEQAHVFPDGGDPFFSTFCGHLSMADWQRDRLFGEIRRRLGQRADRSVWRHRGTVLHVARRHEKR